MAAGEVVERPASVVKEMVENALDAGARSVEVEIQKGGASLIKVTDDGSGMGKEDALMCLERHATSKLKDAKQLSAITTMGFRGEAVPSIASVSKFRLATREHDAVEGTEVIVDGGIVKEVKVAGLQAGTVFEVRQLFFNVPARRKFMRAESTESAHVEHQVKLHALAWPEVRFTMRKDGRTVFDLPSTPDKRTRISGIAGGEAGRKLIEVPVKEAYGMAVHGYVLPAEFARKGRRQQFVFLNGRPIEDPAISRALKDAFKGAVADNLNPSAWLWIEMDPSLVDVNVHPAKKEVRFHKPLEVRQLVLSAVEEAISVPVEPAALRGAPKIISRKTGDAIPVRPKPSEEVSRAVVEVRNEPAEEVKKVVDVKKPRTEAPKPFVRTPVVKQQELVEVEKSVGPQFTILSTLHDRYLLLQGEDGLVLLDPKAARERIVYEGFAGEDVDDIESQGLLVPELIDLDAHDLDVVMTNLENFTEAGIRVEPFGGGTLQVRSMPAVLSAKDPRAFVMSLIDELVETVGGKRGKSLAFEVFAEKLAKRAAWNEVCQRKGAEHLLAQLFECDLPYCTPDGRPTLVHISLKEIERKFS
ncbi:DNA mismatch repair endonuclease MutL [Rubritalea tangerina]|uniref:DNA mismatch repair endonuclease MutL n=1 Tax=Rubritalea tangerina TaxID=430798 RepID=UPI00361D8294